LIVSYRKRSQRKDLEKKKGGTAVNTEALWGHEGKNMLWFPFMSLGDEGKEKGGRKP